MVLPFSGYYQDVLEVTYKPKAQPEKIDTFTANSVKRKLKGMITPSPVGIEFPFQGYLLLGLVNGQKKEYPTSRDQVANFLVVARERVREAKTKPRS